MLSKIYKTLRRLQCLVQNILQGSVGQPGGIRPLIQEHEAGKEGGSKLGR